MSNYYQKQDSKVAIMSILVEKGWKVYGYKQDESDAYTDYWSPARWEGIATKNGFVLVVDQYSTHYSGYEVKEYNYNVKGTSADNYKKIQKLEATLNDSASTENEKEVCKRKIEALENKEGTEPSYTVKEVYPTFSFPNPKSCTWHIEKDGQIIAKGKGLTNIYEMNSRENTRSNAEKFVNKIESKINSLDSLVPVEKAIIKKVIKPVLVTDRKVLQVGDILSFEYHGHFWEVYSVNENTFSYELLGSEKRGYAKLKNGKRYYDYMKKFAENVEKGIIKIYELKEVEEVTYKTVYVKSQRKGKEENLLTSENVAETVENVETTQENKVVTIESNDSITVSLQENEKGIELYFSSIPSDNVRTELKNNKFKWNKYKKCWYTYKTNTSSVLFAEALVSAMNNPITETSENHEQNIEVAAQVENEAIQNDITEAPKNHQVKYTLDNKIQIESINFIWSESGHIQDNTTVNTIQEAENILYNASLHFEGVGYDKTKFEIVWTDGYKYKGRIDIDNSHKGKTTPLKDHIIDHCTFYNGTNKPSHMTQDKYELYLSDVNKQNYTDFLNTYSLTDNTPAEPTPEKTSKVFDITSRIEANKEAETKKEFALHFKNDFMKSLSFEEKSKLIDVAYQDENAFSEAIAELYLAYKVEKVLDNI